MTKGGSMSYSFRYPKVNDLNVINQLNCINIQQQCVFLILSDMPLKHCTLILILIRNGKGHIIIHWFVFFYNLTRFSGDWNWSRLFANPLILTEHKT